MAKTLIGNIKGKNGRGIVSIKKTDTTGSVDTYTITYTDDTTSTFTINNSDSISLQRQIVPSAAVESSATASQAYTAGDYVVVSGVLRKVTAAIAKGNAISDSNSAATTVTGELANSVSKANDYVVEQGVKSDWQYVKWASGRAECSGSIEVSLTKTGTYWLPEVSLPFAFKKTANSRSRFSIFVSGGDYIAPVLYPKYPLSELTVSKVACAAAYVTETGTTTVNYLIRGWWK